MLKTLYSCVMYVAQYSFEAVPSARYIARSSLLELAEHKSMQIEAKPRTNTESNRQGSRSQIRMRLLAAACTLCACITSCVSSPLHELHDQPSSDPLPPATRELELDCPVSIDPGGYDDDPEHGATNRFNEYSKGELGRKMVANLRGKSKAFYQTLVNDIVMATCDVSTQSERCVHETSHAAAKSWDDTCIVAADNVCPVGMCERSSNCYWNSVVPGENRTTRFPPQQYSGAMNRLISYKEGSYARGMAKFVLPGAIIGIITLVFWLIFFVGRYFCCCLWNSCGICCICSPVPKSGGYRKCSQVLFPSLVYMLSLFAIIVAGTIAYIGNEDISVGATRTFYHASGLVEDLGLRLDRSRVPLDNMQNIIYDAAADAEQIFDETAYVKTTALSIGASFATYSSIHQDGLNASEDAQDSFASAIGGFQSQVQPVVDEVQGMLDTLELDLYDNADMIQAAIVSAIDQLDSINGQTDSWQNEVHNVESQEYSIRTYRKLSVMILFLTGLVVTFAGCIGILSSKATKCKSFHKLINIAGILCAILASVSFVLASLSLAVSVLWLDGCQVADIITSDFEPFVGEKIAQGANACFNDTNLAVAMNVTDKVDFQANLDDSLSVIEDVNITAVFATQVLSPLDRIQESIDMITATALGVVNQGTTSNREHCMFNEEYSGDDILQPWLANEDKGMTEWILKSTGTNGNYLRVGSETGSEYIARLYGDVAGLCQASDDCCFEGSCTGLPTRGVCNGGSNCAYPCAELADIITASYAAYLEYHDIQNGMSADLGVTCPLEYTTCPTAEFIAATGNDVTIIELLQAYEANITDTADSLLGLVTTSVGDAMDEVQDFLCNMNVSFVKKRYEKVETELCGRMLGGFAQVNWALWSLAVFLEVAAILANILSTRLHAKSSKEDKDKEGSGQWIMESEARRK